MRVVEAGNLASYCEDVAERAQVAASALVSVTAETKVAWLRAAAALLRGNHQRLTAANELDLAEAPNYGLTEAQVDRLRLTPDRIEAIAVALEEVADLPEPIGQIIETTTRPNGLVIDRVRVPLGVVFFIYESRPNVTADAAAICVKAGNAVILRGGKEAMHSSQAIVQLLHEAAIEAGMPGDAIQLVSTPDRDAVGHFLGMPEKIQLAIPRGGEGLIRRVAEEASMPVIKHYAGNCHVYVDRDADLEMARDILLNAKCQRMGVCNATESLLVHADVAAEFIPSAVAQLDQHGVEVRGDARTCELALQAVPASEEDYAAEYLGPILSAKVVGSLDEAINHINRVGSGHTDAIITQDEDAARIFATRVDSSAVMINASTRFNDGGQFGLGAEIGISTDKFHARGPCGVNELTTYKYVVRGAGQIRQ